MTTGVLVPDPILRFCDNRGNPLVGGQVLTQVGGVNTATYSDVALTTALPNPIILNSRGEVATSAGASSQCFLTPNTVYTFTVSDASGNQIWVATYVNGVQISLSQAAVGAALWPQTAAESAASITPTNYFYPPLDIRRYGADPSGSTASDSALLAAIAVCGSTGGIIRLPGNGPNTTSGSVNSIYSFANQYNLDAKKSIIFQGDSATTAGAQGATLVKYTGTTSPWFIIDSATGIEFRNLQLASTSASFAGTFIRCNNDGTNGDPSFCGVYECTFSSAAAVTYIDINKCILFNLERNNFINGAMAVTATAVGSYSNSIRIRDNQFVGSSQPPIQVEGGNGWVISGNVFEALSSGAPGAIAGPGGVAAGLSGAVIDGNWLGDASTTAGIWINLESDGCSIRGNVFGGSVAGTTAIAIAACQAVEIHANVFVDCLYCINFSTSPCSGVSCKSNAASGCTNTYRNTSNVSLGQFDFSIGFGFSIPSGHGFSGNPGYRVYTDGTIEQWGLATGLSNGNNTITFPIAFPTQCNSATAVLAAIANANATCSVPAASTGTSTFVITIDDSGATTDKAFWRAVGF